jgi:hypothetical protein
MLRAFPIWTFDEIAALQLEVEIYCPACYRYVGPIDLADRRLHGKPFAGTRFRCTRVRQPYSALPPTVCGCLGHVVVRPRPTDFIPPAKSIPWCSISCPRCVPGWEISQAAPHLPPWRGLVGKPGVRMTCPACRSQLTTSWSGGDGIPHPDGYERGIKRPS